MDESVFTPKRIVAELDKHIVGQNDAKRAVAVALRHRWRRSRLEADLQEEITPKNILMIGPTGVGKTEIARRLSRLLRVPFVKVEATKFTEVGYVGRDVDSMVRDLVEVSVRMVKEERAAAVQDRAERMAEDRIVDALVPWPEEDNQNRNPFEMLFGGNQQASSGRGAVDSEERRRIEEERRRVREKIRMKAMEHELIEVDVEDQSPIVPMMGGMGGMGGMDNQMNLGEMFQGLLPKRTKRRKMTVSEARKVLTQEEAQKLIDTEAATADAVWRAEQQGIIFIDEFDKIASSRREGTGPDVSREGVQRDILPIVEGSTVQTKYGPVRTDHMLFIAAGAFHVAKPSDLIPELQGRFPIRVEFQALTEEDFYRILTEPRHSLVFQYVQLLGAEGVTVEFDEGALRAIARFADHVNRDTENIGARRLHTILERVLEELSFTAPELNGQTIPITSAYVQARLQDVADNIDINRYIL